MSLIDSMQMLKDDIKSSRQKRRQDFKMIKQNTRQIQQDTHKRLADAERARREEAGGERRKLADFTKDLKGGVTVLRRGFRQNQKEVRNEILTAGAIWQGKTSVPVKQEKEDKGKKEEEGKKE